MSEEITRLRQEVNDQFSTMRKDIKDLSSAVVEMVRLDSKFSNLNELVNRVAKETDDLEIRLRAVENNTGMHGSRIGQAERMIWVFVTVGSSLVSYLLTSGMS